MIATKTTRDLLDSTRAHYVAMQAKLHQGLCSKSEFKAARVAYDVAYEMFAGKLMNDYRVRASDTAVQFTCCSNDRGSKAKTHRIAAHMIEEGFDVDVVRDGITGLPAIKYENTFGHEQDAAVFAFKKITDDLAALG